MVVLRATQKVLKSLPVSGDDTAQSEAALGDWYVNRIVVDRQPLLLLTSSESRLPIIARARDVKNLPQRLSGMVADRLRRIGIEEHLIRSELAAMDTVHVGRTQDRSITGQMADFARSTPYCLPEGEWDDSDLRHVEDILGKMPCLASRSFNETIFPYRTAHRLLYNRWGGQENLY